jgi:hypothetical protein
VGPTLSYLQTPKFELVSRYAEALVAKKLSLESEERLKSARQDLTQLSGAEGYTGALFEAYAIRKIQSGGHFEARGLNGGKRETVRIPRLEAEPIVNECNTLSVGVVPFGTVRVPDPNNNGTFSPSLYVAQHHQLPNL